MLPRSLNKTTISLANKSLLLLLLLLLLNAPRLSAQLKASFIVDKNSGCISPALLSSFTSTTTGIVGVATYQWDFGNGNTANIKDPSSSFREPKTYTVTLKVTNAGQTSTATTTITVHKNPTADFSGTPLTGCVPLTVTFTATVDAGEGTVDKYVWDFGDGHINNASNLNSTSNIYTVDQKFSVSLTVSNSFGCQSTSTVKTDYVESYPSTTPSFVAAKTTLCSTSDAAQFTNTSTGTGALTYLWNFGDGSTSTDVAPTHAYATKGTYDVKLTATSANKCANTLPKPAYINVANFTSTISLPTAPICQSSYLGFSGTASPTPTSSVWYYSDFPNSPYSYGLYSNNKSFANTGTYTAYLVNNFGGCYDTAKSVFTVAEKPSTKGFIIDNSALCGAPVTVNFKDTTSNTTSWLWNFDYISSATQQKPSYTFTNNGGYWIYLTTKNAAGCSSNEVSKSITISQPAVQITYTNVTYGNDYTLSGCVGMQFNFRTSSATQVVKYNWDFGDGTKATDSTPSHTYPTAGHYIVKLSYTTVNGCTGSTQLYEVNAYDKPKANFYASDTIVCGSNPITFLNFTTPQSQWSTYIVNDSLRFESNANINPTYSFHKAGTFDITMIAWSGEYGVGYCYDTIIKKQYITILPPFPRIASVTNTCDGMRNEVTFIQKTRQAKQWFWDFGDSSGIVTLNVDQQTITHTYAKTGSYIVKHTAINGGCTLVDSVTAYVLLKQKPQLVLDKAAVCGSGTLGVDITGMEKNPETNIYNSGNYLITGIQYADGTYFNGTVTPYYNGYNYFWSTPSYHASYTGLTDGEQNLRIITESYNFGCFDTTNYEPLDIRGPVVGYTVAGSQCFTKPVTFVDTSSAKNKVALTSWLWDFGDGTTAKATGTGNVEHIYSIPGSYYTTLKVTDAEGCTATTSYGSHQAESYGPKADFYWSPFTVVPNSSAYFYNSSNTYGSYSNTYSWHFSSDNSTAPSNYSVYHSYTNALTDTVTLIASSDMHTCIDTIVKYVPVTNINISFRYSTRYLDKASCPPLIVSFTSTAFNVNSINWLFGDGGTAGNNPTPSHTYNTPGVYKVSMIGLGNAGATDTVFQFITVKGPFANIKSDVQQHCLPVTVTLTASNNTSTNFIWDFGDGNLSKDSSLTEIHTYISSGAFTPALIITDSAGCQATFELKSKIISDTLAIAFNNKPLTLCLGNATQFNITAINVAVSYIDSALLYHWDFGTGNANDTSNLDNPAFKYQKAGTYPVTLDVKSITGCEAIAKADITVKPIVAATISGPTIVCEDIATQYLATIATKDSVGWSWTFNNIHTDSTQKPALQALKAATPIDSIYVVTSLDGCPDTTYYPVKVNAKPAIALTPKMDTICQGKSVALAAHDGNNYQWTPNKFITSNSSDNPMVTPPSTTTYIVQVTNSSGCSNTDSSVITVAQPIKVSLPKDSYMCIDSSVQLIAKGATTYKWIVNTLTLSDSTIANPVAKPTVNTTYTVVGYEGYSCFTDKASTTVSVVPKPTVDAGKDVTIPVGTKTTFTPTTSNDAVNYAWTPTDYLSCNDCETPEVTPRSNMTYQITVHTKYGCAASDNISINIKCVGLTLALPSAFAPEGKEENRKFYPMGKGVKIVKHFSIYSRTSEVIFERDNFNINDISSGWDGTTKGKPLPTGTYVYLIEAICDTGEPISDKGTIVLIR